MLCSLYCYCFVCSPENPLFSPFKISRCISLFCPLNLLIFSIILLLHLADVMLVPLCLRRCLNRIIAGKSRCLKATSQLHKLAPLLKCLLRFLRLQYTRLFSLRLPDSETEIFWFSVYNNFLKPSLFSSDILCLMTYIPLH